MFTIDAYTPEMCIRDSTYMTLTGKRSIYRLELKRIRFYREELRLIIRLGIPSGLQNSIISFSNVIVPVSYTHLDVYKRQGWICCFRQNVEGSCHNRNQLAMCPQI